MSTCNDKPLDALFSSVVMLLLLGCLLPTSSQGSDAVVGSRRLLASSTNLYRSAVNRINEAVKETHRAMKTSFRKAPPCKSNPSQNSQPQH